MRQNLHLGAGEISIPLASVFHFLSAGESLKRRKAYEEYAASLSSAPEDVYIR